MSKKLLLFPLFFMFSLALSSQSFEGIVEFKKQEGTNIETSVWYIKDNMVRVDEFEPGSRVLKGCYLINTKDSTRTYLDHKNKTSQKATSKVVTVIPFGTTTEETKNTKEIQTYKTTESIVKSGDSTFSYWMNVGKFGFFQPTVHMLGPTNSFFQFYWALSPKENTMPLLVQKKNAKGEEIGRFEAIRIEKRTIDANLFNVPADYKQL